MLKAGATLDVDSADRSANLCTLLFSVPELRLSLNSIYIHLSKLDKSEVYFYI